MTSIAKNIQAINVKPKSISVIDTKPKDIGVINPKPRNISIMAETVSYIETWTIQKGQPIPWGLNWLITYPVTFSFSAKRM